jgi:hypothetical protein
MAAARQRRLAGDRGRYAIGEVVALVHGVAMGVSAGLVVMGVAHLFGALAIVLAYAGLVVGVTTGAIVIVSLHNSNVELFGGGDDDDDDDEGSKGTGAGGASAKLVVELARLASSLGLNFRLLRAHDGSSSSSTAAAERVQKEVVDTFRPLSWPQVSAMLGDRDGLALAHAASIDP